MYIIMSELELPDLIPESLLSTLHNESQIGKFKAKLTLMSSFCSYIPKNFQIFISIVCWVDRMTDTVIKMYKQYIKNINHV